VLAGKRVLLVEDSMLIALDAEDALRELGAADVLVAPSLSAARNALARTGETPIGLAVLDVNLGAETSLPIAESLLENGTPVLLATGYGEDLKLPEALAGLSVVKKPYDAASLRPYLEAMLAVAEG